MITVTITVENVNTILSIYNQVQLQRADEENGTFTTVSGLGPITLLANVTAYSEVDDTGDSTNWYRSRFYSTSTYSASAWSDPVLGEPGDIFYNPLFPPEIDYSLEELRVIERIRRLIGDPIGLRREYGEDTQSSIHPDGKTYEMDERGWPCSIHVPEYDTDCDICCVSNLNMVAHNDPVDPTVNGYRYLRFTEALPDPVTISGIHYGTDIWYYHFRHSDREIMDAYENQPAPSPLTTATANAEVYMLATSIELLEGELWEDSTEDGAVIKDEGTLYDPSPGLKVKEDMLKALRKKLDNLIKALQMPFVAGVRID